MTVSATMRARFTKRGKVRFLSHRDIARVWERALRKVDLPIAYTEGFTPRPKVHFGLALSVGHESLGEYLDIDLESPLDTSTCPGDLASRPYDDVARRLCDALPDGIDCVALAAITGPGMSLQEAVTSCTWSIVIEGGSASEAADAVAAVLAAPSLIINRERKGKVTKDDIRPYVRSLYLDPDQGRALATIGQPGVPPAPIASAELAAAGGVALVAELGTQPRTLRPAELVAALGPGWRERRVCRLHQWIDHGDERLEPLAVVGAESPWARMDVRAS